MFDAGGDHGTVVRCDLIVSLRATTPPADTVLTQVSPDAHLYS